MRFLVDENLGRAVAEGLAGFGFPTVYVNDEIDPLPEAPSVSDQQIFDHCRDHGMVLITGDYKMHRNKQQSLAMAQAGIGVFVLTGRGNYSRDDLHLMMLKRMRHIVRIARETSSPYVYGIPQKGSIQRLDARATSRARKKAQKKRTSQP